MPIYEYRCTTCGAHLEKMQKVSDEPLKTCESCGGKLEKQWSRTGFQFKGEGWYVTDYSNKGKNETKSETKAEKSSSAESTAKPDGASKTTDGSATKPATKTD